MNAPKLYMAHEEFVKNLDPWSSHRPLLWRALVATRENRKPILEMGCGDGSTPYLQEFARRDGRELISMDNNREWADKFGARYTENWHYSEWFYKSLYSVVLIDHAPGEKRREALELFASFPIHITDGVIVVHDSEPKGWNASDYQVRPLFSKFKYIVEDEPEEKGAPWTTALSNDVII